VEPDWFGPSVPLWLLSKVEPRSGGALT
jgi:hypothetical protein